MPTATTTKLPRPRQILQATTALPIPIPHPKCATKHPYTRTHTLFNNASAGKISHGSPAPHTITAHMAYTPSKSVPLSSIECGYTTDSHHGLAEVMICYNDIIAIHSTVSQNWSNDRYGTSGPQLIRIVAKELAVFPRLISTSAEDVVDFYDRLHEMSAPYLLPTTPLDAIVLQHGYEGLFPPALGTI